MTKDIFSYRESIQPYEYPHLLKYADAIHESFWTPEHFTYDRDVSDFKNKLTSSEQEAVKRSMLAIGVVENKVKTFWARIDHRMPKTEISDVGHTFAGNECHKEGTEILTPNGWTDFRDLEHNSTVMQYDTESCKITPIEVEGITVKDFKGDLIRYKNQNFDLCVTPNHRMIYKNQRFETKELFAKEFNYFSDRMIPISGEYLNEGENSLTSMDKLKIAIQADGTELYYVSSEGKRVRRGKDGGYSHSIVLKKESKKDRLRSILKSSNLNFTETNLKRKGYTSFKFNLYDSVNYKKFDWVSLQDKTQNWCKEFIEEILEWDGFKDDKRKNYVSTEKSCIDKVQAVAILSGYSTHISKSEDNRKKSYKTRYSLSIKSGNHYRSKTLKSTKEYYEGKVYCVTVPSGVLITRFNDRVSITGNCIHRRTYEKLLNLLGLNKEFETVLEVPCMQGRSKYLTKYLSGITSRSNKEFTKSLILFTLLVENASLFTQFLIVASFNKYKRQILSNFNTVVTATGREENLHGQFGAELIKIIREQHPEWFDEEMEQKIRRNIRKAYRAEVGVIEWIFEKGELDFLPKDVVVEYLKQRFNHSLNQIGYEPEYEINEELIAKTEFFDMSVKCSIAFDFFNEKSSDYSQVNLITENDWE